MAEANFPIKQGVHKPEVVESLDLPAGHCEQEVLAPADDVFPGEQTSQS